MFFSSYEASLSIVVALAHSLLPVLFAVLLRHVYMIYRQHKPNFNWGDAFVEVQLKFFLYGDGTVMKEGPYVQYIFDERYGPVLAEDAHNALDIKVCIRN